MDDVVDFLELSVNDELVPQDKNLFKPLVPDAYRVIRRAMLNQTDAKLGVAVAQDVLDRAGETRKPQERIRPHIVIKDSQIQLLVAGMQEAKEFSKRGENENERLGEV